MLMRDYLLYAREMGEKLNRVNIGDKIYAWTVLAIVPPKSDDDCWDFTVQCSCASGTIRHKINPYSSRHCNQCHSGITRVSCATNCGRISEQWNYDGSPWICEWCLDWLNGERELDPRNRADTQLFANFLTDVWTVLLEIAGIISIAPYDTEFDDNVINRRNAA